MNKAYELRKSSGKGEGIFALNTFRIGDTVMVGVIREILDGNHSHASQVGENEYVLHAGLITKVNHSCDPNCGIRTNPSGAHDYIAIKEIVDNEEITFDYSMRNYIIDYFPSKCMCGSRTCRGRITGWKDLPDEKKQQYADYVAPYLLELDARNSCANARNMQNETS